MPRLISGAVLLAAVVGALWFLAPIYLLAIAIVVALLAFREYAALAERTGVRVSRPAGATAVVLITMSVGMPGLPIEAALAGTTLGLAALVLSDAMTNTRQDSAALQSVGISVFAPMYIGVPLGLLSLTRWTLGREATLLLILTVAISDTFQYYSGRTFGRHLA